MDLEAFYIGKPCYNLIKSTKSTIRKVSVFYSVEMTSLNDSKSTCIHTVLLQWRHTVLWRCLSRERKATSLSDMLLLLLLSSSSSSSLLWQARQAVHIHGEAEFSRFMQSQNIPLTMASPKCLHSAAHFQHFGYERSKCSAVSSPLPECGKIGYVIRPKSLAGSRGDKYIQPQLTYCQRLRLKLSSYLAVCDT